MATARSSPSGIEAAPLLRGTNLTVNPDDTLSPLARPRRFFDWDYASASVNLGYWGMTSRPIDAVYSSDNFVDSMTIRA